jgi:hypothetical protein
MARRRRVMAIQKGSQRLRLMVKEAREGPMKETT